VLCQYCRCHIAARRDAHIDVKGRNPFTLLPSVDPIKVPMQFMAIHIKSISHERVPEFPFHLLSMVIITIGDDALRFLSISPEIDAIRPL